MEDADKALEALKIQIKKEIIDNYFAERCYLEEESQILDEEVAAYQQEFSSLSRLFQAFYAALGHDAAITQVMKSLSLKVWPFYEDFQHLPLEARRRLLNGYPHHGLTAWRRYFNLVLDTYQKLAAACRSLKEQYDKITIHLRLFNEDTEKFNLSFDFGLIAAQIEAMEGGGEVISGGLLCGEREELSTRMRFKRRTLPETELPPPPVLLPVEAVKGRLKSILGVFSP